MKCLVTGSAGFIASHLTDKLIEQGYEVIGIDNLSSGKIENVNPKSNFYNFDITADLTKWNFADVDCVFHLAAIPRVPYSVKNPLETHRTNVDGTLNVLLWARDHAKKVVFASSSSVYGNQKLPFKETMRAKPISPYALHKAIGEDYMKLFDGLYNLPTVSLRFFNVYGPRCDPNSEYSLVIGKFIKQKSEGKPLTIYGNGEQTRDFTYVSDIVDGLVAGMGKGAGIINLCNGRNISINKIAELIGGEKQYLSSRNGDAEHTLGSNLKAKKLLNWTPKVQVEEGIKTI